METVLDQKCGKTLITDNTTRWNSSYYMAKRVLELRGPVNDVLAEMKIDSLLVAEWSRLAELVMLLEPFATQTDNLQSNKYHLSLSYAIPSLLDLQCHLQSIQHCKTLTKALLTDIHQRFGCLLIPDSPSFIPLPVASCRMKDLHRLLRSLLIVFLMAPGYGEIQVPGVKTATAVQYYYTEG
jgi:hypothetical protein